MTGRCMLRVVTTRMAACSAAGADTAADGRVAALQAATSPVESARTQVRGGTEGLGARWDGAGQDAQETRPRRNPWATAWARSRTPSLRKSLLA